MLPNKLKLYLVGVCSGAVLVANYRSVTKETIKVGVRGMSTLRRTAARGAESLADLTQEALWELQAKSTKAQSPTSAEGHAHVEGNGVNGAAGPKERVTIRSEP